MKIYYIDHSLKASEENTLLMFVWVMTLNAAVVRGILTKYMTRAILTLPIAAPISSDSCHIKLHR